MMIRFKATVVKWQSSGDNEAFQVDVQVKKAPISFNAERVSEQVSLNLRVTDMLPEE